MEKDEILIERLERLRKAVAYLKGEQIIRYQKDIHEAMKIGKSSLSSAMNGDPKYLTESFLKKFCQTFLAVSEAWLLSGEGQMIQETSLLNVDGETQTLSPEPIEFNNLDNSKIKEYQDDPTPLFDIEVTAGVVAIFKNPSSQVPIGQISIPRMPKCDGAVTVTGDSMYPLIKSGDYVLFKIITDLPASILFGNMYIISFEIEGDEHVMVKYIQKGKDDSHIVLVSENQHHANKEIHIKQILGMALVKASVRFNFST